MDPTRLHKESSNGNFKASRRNAISKLISSQDHESYTEPDRDNFIFDTTKTKRYERLVNAMSSNGTFDSSVLATISKEFSSGCILHEAIRLGVPEHVLMLLADRFPIFLTQVDENGRYPIHVACVFGASSEFVSRCIDANPSSAAAKDIEGKTPIHLLCQGTGYWDKSNPTAERTMIDILSKLYSKAPSSIVSEDNHGIGSVEYAIESNLGIKLILDLQEKIGQFKENEARKMTHQKCVAARRQLQRKNSPHAAFEA